MATADQKPYSMTIYGILLERLLLESKAAEIRNSFQVEVITAKDKNEITFKATNPTSFYRNNFMGYIKNLLRPLHRLKLRNVHIPNQDLFKQIPQIEKTYGVVLYYDSNKNAFLIQGGEKVWTNFMKDLHKVLNISWEYFSNSRKEWVRLDECDQEIFRVNLPSTTYFVVDSGSDIDLQINLSAMTIVDESGNIRNLRTVIDTHHEASETTIQSKENGAVNSLYQTFHMENQPSAAPTTLPGNGAPRSSSSQFSMTEKTNIDPYGDRSKSPIVHLKHGGSRPDVVHRTLPPTHSNVKWNLFAQFPRLSGIPLRKVMIHGTNVALSYGSRVSFNTKGISLMVDYFKSCGVSVMISLPKFRTFNCPQNPPIADEEEIIKAFTAIDLFMEVPKGMDEYLTALEYAYLSNSIIISEKSKIDELPPHLAAYASTNTFTYRFDGDRVYMTRELTRRLHFDDAITQKSL